MVDVAIRYGDGVWPDGRAVLLCEDELVFPVCSPDYAAGCRLPETADDLLDHALLDYETVNPGWIGWKGWLSALSVARPRPPLLRRSHYTAAIPGAPARHGRPLR